jgi:5-formyltetrahydrofolate cyclo-ligase
MDIPDEKKILRLRMKGLRAGLEMAEYRSLNMSIMTRCHDLEELNRARTVHIYVSTVNNETDTLGLIYTLLDQGKKVVVPRCAPEPRRLQHMHIESLDELRPSKFGIMEPPFRAVREIMPPELDLVIAPLLAFDRSGGRLGFGGGYYDHFLAACSCPKAGLAYSFQEVEKIPREPHDCSLDIIITEKEIVRVR